MRKILVTGCAGFIGSNLVDRLLADGFNVVGVDNFNDYYDPKIKEVNIRTAVKSPDFKLYKEDILNLRNLSGIFEAERFDCVIHLAARAGIRPSIENPSLYAQVNILGTVNILKLCKDFGVKKFIFGSSSSVYGNAKKIPFVENDSCNQIISPYGASKRVAEFFVESMSKKNGIKSVILRFFTVYGPRGRVDMAPYKFLNAIMNNYAIEMYGDGSTSRDYTYIDDVVDAIVKSVEQDLEFEVINIGNSKPVNLLDFINLIEKITNKKAIINKLPYMEGDVIKTWANISKAKKVLGWQPNINLEEGLKRTVEYYKLKNSNNKNSFHF